MTDFTDCEIINYGHVGEKFLDTINNLKTYDRERNLSPMIMIFTKQSNATPVKLRNTY